MDGLHDANAASASSPIPPLLRREKQHNRRLPAGTPLGDFRILREVGRGGMGVVYEAEQISLGRRVALKVLPFAATLDAAAAAAVPERGAGGGPACTTRNIVPVYAVGCERGVHYYAMQFIDGQTLAALIRDLRQAAGDGRTAHRPAGGLTSRAGRRPLPGGRARHRSRRVRPTDAGRTSARWPGSGCRRPRRWSTPTSWASSTATSSRPTCCWTARGNLWVTDFGLAQLPEPTPA